MNSLPNYIKITNEEHQQYLTQDYLDNRTREFPSMMQENFLSEEELEIFDYYWKHPKRNHFIDRSMQGAQERVWGPGEYKTAEYNNFSDIYTNPWWAGLKEVIVPKVQAWLGQDIYIPYCHILDSHYPYGIHTDAQQQGFIHAPHPAWTIIVPLEDYNSKTYVFNEKSIHKQPDEDLTLNERDKMCVSQETFDKDFAGLQTPEHWLKKLTVDGTFPWKRGRAICSDRYKFHSSDNYYNNGIMNKRAIIMWTTHV